jgi:hypothetical protein
MATIFSNILSNTLEGNPKLIATRILRKFNVITIKLALLLRGTVDS